MTAYPLRRGKNEDNLEIYNQAEKTSRLISSLINYLRTNERLYQQEKPEKRKKL
jgi:hypothetical protein